MTGAALLDHLWQSTLFALVAWGLAALLRRHPARVRFWVWIIASAKFLVPFSWLAMLGARVGWPVAANVIPPLDATAVTTFVAPVSTFTAEAGAGDITFILAGVWALGTALLLTRWTLRWWQLRGVVRGATATDIVAPVPVLASVTLREPGVAGVFRPVLLLPEKIADRLGSDELRAVLEHELCHVRRRDNFWAALHMLVEAAFWFHPLVWWLGGRLIEERERACDEAVLDAGADPRSYARGILKVCQFYMASELACVSGVSGANLKFRLEGIMKNQKIVALTRGWKWALGLVAVATLAVPVMSGMAASGPVAAAPATTAGKIELLADRRVKLDYQNVDVRSLLEALARAAKVNMLVSDQVTGTVTVRLEAMPWEQALDVVLASQGLGRHENAGIIIVEPLATTAKN